jgi:hypothetical protein
MQVKTDCQLRRCIAISNEYQPQILLMAAAAALENEPSFPQGSATYISIYNSKCLWHLQKKISSGFRKSLWTLFQQSGRWFDLASDQCVPPPIGDTFRASVTEAYNWGDHHPKDHSEKELAHWLTQHGSINITHATQLEVFAECLASSIALSVR